MKTVLVIIAMLLIIALGFAWYIGIFSAIKTENRETGGFVVAGHEFTGPYSKAGTWISEVNKQLNELGITSSKSFGIYYDDPKLTSPEKCRSFVGSILEETEFGQIEKLKSAGLKIDSVPVSKSIVAEFPMKTSLSYMIGPMKAYPAISKHINSKNYVVTLSLEIYDMPEKKITYIMQYSE